jgi:hypothetical protein
MERIKITTPLLFIALGLIWGAASKTAAAPLVSSEPHRQLSSQRSRANQPRNATNPTALPHPVIFREVKERGLLVEVWINKTGPYNFAVDTGAGITLIGSHVASMAGTDRQGSYVSLGGLSGVSQSEGKTTIIGNMAIGDRANYLRANQSAIIINNLPRDIDGILDPTDAYSPFGYSIDLPNRELAAFNAKDNPLRINDVPEGGTIVRWLANGPSRRPFVRLGDGRLALLDTGSGFGLAVSEDLPSYNTRRAKSGVQDIGGGEVVSKRVGPTTISIGSLVLRGVPTDVLTGVEKEAPILLGRDALYPFRLTFDPVQRLIEISPVSP